MTQRTTFEPRADETMESYLVIHQTYSSIRVNGLYAISDSQSLSADFAIGKSRACCRTYSAPTRTRCTAPVTHHRGAPRS
jgi:hypothetical protein